MPGILIHLLHRPLNGQCSGTRPSVIRSPKACATFLVHTNFRGVGMTVKESIIGLVPQRLELAARFNYNRILGRLEPEMNIIGEISPQRRRCIDIGANVGLYTYRFAKMFRQVESFEPILILCSPLCLRFCARLSGSGRCMTEARWSCSAPTHPPRHLKKKRHVNRPRPGDYFRAGRTGSRGGTPGGAGPTYDRPPDVHSASYGNGLAQHIGATATGLE